MIRMSIVCTMRAPCGTSLTHYDGRVTMKPVIRHGMWLSTLLVLVMTFGTPTQGIIIDQPSTQRSR